MLGFLIGTGCLIALCKIARHRGRWGPGHCGGAWHHHGCHGHEGGWRGWRGRHRRHDGGHDHGVISMLLDRLGISPDQERVIGSELSSIHDQLHRMKDALRRSGADVARAVRAESFDAEIMGEVFAAHDDALREARKELVASMARVHEALDPRQRERLADWLESGRGPWRGPYRGFA